MTLPILVLDGERSLKKLSISDFSKESLDLAAKRVREQKMSRTLEEIAKEGY